MAYVDVELLGGGNCTLTKAGETYVTENGVGPPSAWWICLERLGFRVEFGREV